MARSSIVAREYKREAVVKRYAQRRSILAKKRSDLSLSEQERWEAQIALQKLPRNSSSCRLRNRCAITGRPRGVFRRFNLSRTQIREQAMEGNLPGVKKASW